MEERYTKLYELPEPTGDGALRIESGTLFRDNESGKNLIRLKLKNTTERTVQGVTIKISLPGSEQSGVRERIIYHEYTSLSQGAFSTFEMQNPIYVPATEANYFRAAVVEVKCEGDICYRTEEAVPEEHNESDSVFQIEPAVTMTDSSTSTDIHVTQKKKRRVLFTLVILMVVAGISLAAVLIPKYMERQRKEAVANYLIDLCNSSKVTPGLYPLYGSHENSAICGLGFQRNKELILSLAQMNNSTYAVEGMESLTFDLELSGEYEGTFILNDMIAHYIITAQDYTSDTHPHAYQYKGAPTEDLKEGIDKAFYSGINLALNILADKLEEDGQFTLKDLGFSSFRVRS